jgi:hypothetical protein
MNRQPVSSNWSAAGHLRRINDVKDVSGVTPIASEFVRRTTGQRGHLGPYLSAGNRCNVGPEVFAGRADILRANGLQAAGEQSKIDPTADRHAADCIAKA